VLPRRITAPSFPRLDLGEHLSIRSRSRRRCAPLCQRRETGELSVAQNNSAVGNIPVVGDRVAVGRAAVGNRAARNSRRAAPPRAAGSARQ
jgi:hypothetical protein